MRQEALGTMARMERLSAWRVAGIAVVALASASAARDARAAPPTEADALFIEGRELLEKGRFAEACAKLQRSEELAPAVGTLLNLGYCREQVGRMRSSMEAYAEAEVLAQRAGDAKRAAFARERFAAVEPRATRLVIRVVDASVPGLEIRRNDAVVPRTDWNQPIPVDPEEIAISARASGRGEWKGVIIVRGEGATAIVIVPPLQPVDPDRTGSVSVWSSLGVRRTVALGLGAATVSALAASLATGIGAKARYDEAGPHCDDTGCDEVGAGIQRRAAAQGDVATGLLALGVVFAGAGAYLWIVGGEHRATPATSASAGIRPFLGLRPLGASAGATF